MFFDKSCNIYTITHTKVGGSTKRKTVSIYKDISCNFEITKSRPSNLEIGKNANTLQYNVVVGIENSQIRNGYNVELIDTVLGSMGYFVISSVQSLPSIGGDVSCINFIASQIEGQL